jgi:hypothetical protein
MTELQAKGQQGKVNLVLTSVLSLRIKIQKNAKVRIIRREGIAVILPKFLVIKISNKSIDVYNCRNINK